MSIDFLRATVTLGGLVSLSLSHASFSEFHLKVHSTGATQEGNVSAVEPVPCPIDYFYIFRPNWLRNLAAPELAESGGRYSPEQSIPGARELLPRPSGHHLGRTQQLPRMNILTQGWEGECGAADDATQNDSSTKNTTPRSTTASYTKCGQRQTLWPQVIIRTEFVGKFLVLWRFSTRVPHILRLSDSLRQ